MGTAPVWKSFCHCSDNTESTCLPNCLHSHGLEAIMILCLRSLHPAYRALCVWYACSTELYLMPWMVMMVHFIFDNTFCSGGETLYPMYTHLLHAGGTHIPLMFVPHQLTCHVLLTYSLMFCWHCATMGHPFMTPPSGHSYPRAMC